MLGSWINRYQLWRLKREAINTLHGFNDRQLSDVGTFRDSIELFVAERAKAGARQPSDPRAYRAVRTTAKLETWKGVTP